ncbi:unnamed protein product [Phaedon cochleariae]|uniref:G-protein coupled receptors family 1 profile domain-containing protein n=1 Tax=Phaedon cochleariae TaxID=80249 RepID=A0A9N9SM90_PHACE|nr:unnamed protein product [Phaedon cochleariae]
MNETFVNISRISQNETLLQNTSDNFVYPYNERPETYVVPVIFLLIFVIGIIGNGTLVTIFIRHKNMRNIPNTYIMSLALADLLVLLTSVPFTSVIYTMDSWPWGATICKISETAKDVSVAVSVFTLTALSADRFFAIVDPLKRFHTSGGSRSAKRVTICVSVSIWVAAFLLAAPAAAGSHIKALPSEEEPLFSVCYPFPELWLNGTYPKVMVMGKFLTLYVAPLTVIAVFYFGMAMSLITSMRNVPGEMRELNKQVLARKKVAITVLVFVGVFAVCLAPSHAFMIFFYFNPRSDELYDGFWHFLRISGFCLFYINSCANPIALYFVSGAFRKYYNRYLLCIKTNFSRRSSQRNRQTSISLLSSRTSHSASRRDKVLEMKPMLDTRKSQNEFKKVKDKVEGVLIQAG